MGIERLVLYLVSFGILSYGSGLIVNTISAFTRRVKIPPFIFSFFVVGILTSVAEIAVAINAVSIHQPEIFVGSLLGGTLVIFLVVIPLMTIMSGGLHVKKHLGSRNLLVTLGIIATPALFTLDKTITNTEGFILVALYVSLFFIIRGRNGSMAKVEAVFKHESKSLRENTLLRLLAGGALVFGASRFIVEQTLIYSEHYHVSAFLVSSVVIAIGSNVPEISLAVQTARSNKAKAEDIAVGDFLGSAAANVLIFGVFTLINNGEVTTAKNFTSTFVFIVLALTSFYVFTRGKAKLTSKEGVALIIGYLLFVAIQFTGL